MFTRPRIRFAEPGSDPTSEASGFMEAPKLSGCLIWLGIGLAVLLIGGQIAYSNGAADAPEALPTVAVLPSLTPTSAPSATPRFLATWTPPPTYTLYPTYTVPALTTASTRAALVQVSPSPTEPIVVDAPILATWTPGAWMLTRFHTTLHPATSTATPTQEGER